MPTNTTSTITAANLAVTGVSAVGTRVYDGTPAAMLAGTAAVTALGSDVVSLDGAGAGVFADRNVGTAKAITVSGFTLSGTDAGNYSLVQPSGLTANVTAAALTLSTSNVSKTYDSGLSALGAAVITSGSLFSPDTISGGSFAFTDKNAGSGNKTITTSGVTVNDGNGGNNYALTYANNSTSTITAANLAVNGMTAIDKVYDGTAAAALSGTAAVNPIGDDLVSVGGAGIGAFDDPNVGANKAVAVRGFTLSGTDAGNYSIVQPMGLNADVTPLDTPPTLPPQTPPTTPPEIPIAPWQALPIEVAQLESDVLKSQSTAHEELSLSSIATKETHECSSVSAPPSDAVSLEWGDCAVVSIGGISGPRLRIVNGGMRLPDTMGKVANE